MSIVVITYDGTEMQFDNALSFELCAKMAFKEAAKKAVRQELEKKGEKLHEQLDKVLGF